MIIVFVETFLTFYLFIAVSLYFFQFAYDMLSNVTQLIQHFLQSDEIIFILFISVLSAVRSAVLPAAAVCGRLECLAAKPAVKIVRKTEKGKRDKFT